MRTYDESKALLNLDRDDAEAADAASAELQVLVARPGVLKKHVVPALESLAKGIGTSASSGLGELLVKVIEKLVSSLH